MLEKLEGKQRKKLQEALMSAFTDFTKLEQMVSFGLNENLNNLAGGHNSDLGYVIFKLIEWAESNGKLQKLLIVVRSEEDGGNSGNADLKKICEELLQGQTATKQSHRLLNPCNFDLTQLIEDCLEKLDDKQGLVGLAIPCGDDVFQKNLCQRLKDALGISNITIKTSLALNPRITSVDRAVNQINLYKTILKTKDLICPIQIQVFDHNSNIAGDFWQKICTDFKDECEHRLIIIMWGSEGCIFPKDVIPLNPPQFKKVHAHLWVREVTNSLDLEWKQQEVMQEWKRIMITACCQDTSQSDPQSELLDIIRVYEHIEETRELLQQNLSAKDFLQELEQRIQGYV